jgi:hypothetical protein
LDNSNEQSSGLLTPQQARFVYLFGGLFPIITSVVTPLSVYRKVLKKPNASDIQRYNDLLQEVSRQLVSGSIGIISYFSGGALANGLQKLFHKKTDQESSQNTSGSQYVRMFVGGHLLSFVGYSFIRPAIQTDLLYLVRLKEGAIGQSPSSSHPGWQGKVRRWVEQHLVPNGQPQLKKTALLSVLGLGGYLGGLGLIAYGVTYGLSKMGKNKADKMEETPQASIRMGMGMDKPGNTTVNKTQALQFGQNYRNSYATLNPYHRTF